MRKTLPWLCVVLLGAGCTDLTAESIRIDVCEQKTCDFGTTLAFDHRVLDDIGAAREGTVTVGGKAIAFACDESGAGSGEGFACVPKDGTVRLLGIAREKPAGLEVSVRFPETNLGFDGTVNPSYADTCEGACVDGNAFVLLEAQGALPAACVPAAEGCSAESCRIARESCLLLPNWMPNYTWCENATGAAVEDWSHCVATCEQLQLGARLECASQWAASCEIGGGMEEAFTACGTCDDEIEHDVECVRSCSDANAACNRACPDTSMGACLDCSAACGLAYAACADACRS